MNIPEWGAPLFEETYRYFAIEGGRGGAKSRTVAAALIARASQKPLRILCGREVQRSIKDSVKRLLDDEIKRCGLGDFFESTDSEIRGANGSLFLFAGLKSNIDSIKSIEAIDICWIEEAQTISYVSLKTLIPTIRKPGSQLIFTWNPKSKDDPVDAMFSGDEKPPRTCHIQVNYDKNPWFPDELREEMDFCKRIDYDAYLHIWEGRYLTNSETRVFKNWTVETFEAPKDAVLRFGADWGFANDPTVLSRGYLDGRTIYIDYEAHMVGCEIVNTPELFMSIPESEKWPIVADSSRPETISHMRKNGFPKIMGSVKGPNSVEEGIEWLKSYNIVVHPRCKHTIDEFTMYSYKKDPLTDIILPILEDKNNHVMDAIRYMFEAVRRTAKAMKRPNFIPIPTVNKW